MLQGFIVSLLLSTSATVPDPATARAPALRVSKLLQAPASARVDSAGLKGKVVVLEFWATWCAPCVAAIPHLNELSRSFPSDKVVIIAVTDESEERVHRFLAKHPMMQWIGLDEHKFAFGDFNVHSLPTTVVISPSGEVARVTVPQGVSRTDIQALLAGEYTPPPTPPPIGSAAISKQEPLFQVEISLSTERDLSYSYNIQQGLLVADAIPVRDALGIAHDIAPTRILGPATVLDQWLAIQAHVPPEAASKLRDALDGALSTSFGIRTKRENRDITVYYLRLTPEGPLGIHVSAPGQPSHLSTDKGIVIATSSEVGALARELESVLGAPVIDETKLTGKYDWDLSYDASAAGGVDQALRKQLGVALVTSSQLIEVLVVERQERP